MGFQHMTAERRAELGRQGGRIGGATRAGQFTAEFQSTAGRAGSSAQKAAAGRKGWATVVARYGADYAAKLAAEWRRDHPNAYEVATMAALDYLGFVYRREVLVRDVYADFVLSDLPAVIEVDHPQWHTNNALHGEDRVGRDRYKNGVYAAAGLVVIRLDPTATPAAGIVPALDVALHALAFAGAPRGVK